MNVTRLVAAGILLGLSFTARAQSVGIGTTTPAPAALLELKSTTQGLLLPRLTLAERTALTTNTTAPPVAGLVIYQTDNTPGLYAYNGTGWVLLNADNLGNHTATQSLNLGGNLLTGGGTAGLGVANAGNATATVNTQPLLRLIRPTTSSVKWPNELQIGLGSYGTAIASQSRADFSLIDGGTNTVDRTVLSLLANGRVGIGTTTPEEALDVAGTAQAQQFAFAAPQTRYLAVSCTAFASIDAGAYRDVTAIGSSTATPISKYLAGGTAGQPGYLVAPVSLPQGAVITGLQLTALDSDGTTVSPQVQLTALQPRTGGTVTLLLIGTGTLTAENGEWQTASVTTSHVVANDSYQYQLRIRLNQNSSNTQLFGVRITYTVTQPE